MTHNRIIALLMVVLIAAVVIPFPGCDSSGTSPISPEASPGGSSQPDPTAPPISVYVAISPVPKLGETADLTFTTQVKNSGLSLYGQKLVNSRAWVEFYYTNPFGSYSEAKHAIPVAATEVLVSGDAEWKGDAGETRTIRLGSKVRFPKEGIWTIRGFFAGEGHEEPLEHWAQIVVTKELAADLRKSDYKAGPLAYLGNFSYGRVASKTLNEVTAPVTLELDISKAPRVGEEALLSCRIYSLYDVPDFSARIDCWRTGEPKISPDTILMHGDLGWQGDLKSNQMVEFSAYVKFPREGEWEIIAVGNTKENEANNRAGFVDNLKMTIASDRGFFGWEQRYPTTAPDQKPASPTPAIRKTGTTKEPATFQPSTGSEEQSPPITSPLPRPDDSEGSPPTSEQGPLPGEPFVIPEDLPPLPAAHPAISP